MKTRTKQTKPKAAKPARDKPQTALPSRDSVKRFLAEAASPPHFRDVVRAFLSLIHISEPTRPY